ncbi:MAG: putative lipid II flippase FtsW [Oscillospiraceae bacterium]|nr:putative lipid II flippase FtsW [Oscillospiraceae bacterium]
MDLERQNGTAAEQEPAQGAGSGALDVPFLVLTLLLTAIGLIIMFSASYARAFADKQNSTYFFVRQAIFAVGGIVVMLVITRFDYHLWRTVAFPILAVAILFLLLVLIAGKTINGSTRWFELFGISFQPSEIAKFAVVVVFATMISSYKEKMKTFRYGVVPFAAILGGIVALLALEPHLSGIIIIGAVGALMMFYGGTQLRWFLIGAAAAGLFLLVYLKVNPYAMQRITYWQDPFQDASDNGYQAIQSLYAIGSGGFFGLGLGRSRQKYLYLPEESNDYVFSILCEELGYVGAMLVILLFVLLIIRGFWLAMHARDRFGALMIAGLVTLMALQVFFNIGVVTGFLPPTGISLPFFSQGGTALMLNLFEMGVVLQVSRKNGTSLLV